MKFLKIYKLFVILPLLSGCCCSSPNYNSSLEYQDSKSAYANNSNVGSETENSAIENANPIDMMKKSMELKQLQDKYIKAQNDPNTSEQDLQKLEEEMSVKQEEMEKMADKIQESGKFKGTPYENYFQKAKEARQNAQEARARAEEAEKEAMEQDYTVSRNKSYEADFEPLEEGSNE